MNTVDFLVIVIMILSIALAVLRGFTREVLTIIAWIGAALAVIFGLPIAQPLFEKMFESPSMAKIVAGTVLGLTTLVVLSLISNQIGKVIKRSGLGPVDRSLGAFFGAARGAILVCLIYILLESLMQPLPPWVTQAKLDPLLAEGATYLKSIAPDEIAGLSVDKPEGIVNDKNETEIPDASAPTPAPGRGYRDKERNGMNDLLENSAPLPPPPPVPPTPPNVK
jgi:membrane protein required for colicin V production